MPMRVDDKNSDVLLLSLTGLESQNSEEDVVVQGSGLSRGDKRRNAKLARLRELVPTSNAILAIDLADEKQAMVLTDHDLGGGGGGGGRVVGGEGGGGG